MKPRWRRSEEKVITDEFSRTSRLDEAINAQRGIATPSSASLAVLVRTRREEPILLIHICFLSFYPQYPLSTHSHDLKPNFHKASRSLLIDNFQQAYLYLLVTLNAIIIVYEIYNFVIISVNLMYKFTFIC